MGSFFRIGKKCFGVLEKKVKFQEALTSHGTTWDRLKCLQQSRILFALFMDLKRKPLMNLDCVSFIKSTKVKTKYWTFQLYHHAS